MAHTYQAEGWQQYIMNWHDPHRQLEPLECEIEIVDQALATLVQASVLSHSEYSGDKMLAHRAAVREHFDIPWTAITPRMQRLIYAINAIVQPQVMVAVGIFCGNTFISNAGAAIGPGACYKAQHLVGIEIRPSEAERARRNVNTIHDNGQNDSTFVEIVAADGIPWLQETDDSIDLLYLDADGRPGQGKSIYLELIRAALHRLHPGSLVLAHNSVNEARSMADYLQYVRDPTHMRASVNMIIDDQGLEVSLR